MPLIGKRTHTSKINAKRLLDDLASSYTHSVEETVVVEIIANSLDAGASTIALDIDAKKHSLTITDNGVGMSENDFTSYHDLAETTKVRGKGIGFAGLGAKLAHLLATEVKTDTRSSGYAHGSDWGWNDTDLAWKERRSRLKTNGTSVSLVVTQDSELLSPIWLDRCIRRHYAPLLDPELATYYVMSSIYPRGIMFKIDGRAMAMASPASAQDGLVHRDVKRPRAKQPIGRALFALSKSDISEDSRGIALATRGKVIKRDTLGMSPRKASRIFGLIEIPDLVESLTTTKLDFLEHGSLGQKYRRLKEQAQKVYVEWLAEIGENVGADEAKRSPRTLENELARITKSVRELDYLRSTSAAVKIAVPDKAGTDLATELQGILLTGSDGRGSAGDGNIPSIPGSGEGTTLTPDKTGPTKSKARNRRAPSGPSVKLVHDPDNPEMSWLSGDTIMINTAHSAYVKAQREGQTKAHQRISALVALCAGASDENGLDLLKRALSSWGRN